MMRLLLWVCLLLFVAVCCGKLRSIMTEDGDGAVLHLTISTMRDSQVAFTLTPDGTMRRNTAKPGSSAVFEESRVDMTAFWAEWQPVLSSIVAEKAEGWDQLRVSYERSCQPIYNLIVQEQGGNTRKFGIYGYPAAGRRLESGDPLPEHYSALFQRLLLPTPRHML